MTTLTKDPSPPGTDLVAGDVTTFQHNKIIDIVGGEAGLTINRAIVSDATGNLVPATTTDTELGFVNGVTSAIQTQINSKAASSHTHVATTDLTATGTKDATTFLRGDDTWAVPGDMVLASAQTNTGTKTFLDATFLLRNVANTFNGQFTNTNTAGRTYTLQDSSHTLVGKDTTDILINKTINDFTNFNEADGEHIQVRNTSGVTLNKGEAVFVSGFNVGQNLPEVELADASTTATMQAIGIVEDTTILNNANGGVDVSGRLEGIDTSSFSVPDDLFVSETPGELTDVKPTGVALIQKIAIVLRSHASLGVIEIIGAGRENDIPNTMSDTVFTVADDANNTKQVDMSVGGATASTKTTLTFAQTANRTITFPDADITVGSDITTINFVIDGGGSAITTGVKGTIAVDFPGTVEEWAVTADQSGSIVVDVNKSTFAGYPTTATMTASEKPTITTSTKGEDRTLTTWSAIVAGDILEFEVDSAATLTRATVSLKVTKTA